MYISIVCHEPFFFSNILENKVVQCKKIFFKICFIKKFTFYFFIFFISS